MDSNHRSTPLLFQSTPPCGGRLMARRHPRRDDAVSIHAPVRGATTQILGRTPLLQVSIHAPVRGATIGALLTVLGQMVSIHAPVRGATFCYSCQLRPIGGFNPRPRAGGDAVGQGLAQGVDVSIHAPVRGATITGSNTIVGRLVSIHAPVRGATNRTPDAPLDITVSIHAPVRGATAAEILLTQANAGFNPRPRAGGDTLDDVVAHLRKVSIHAPVRGATFPAGVPMPPICFNPRPRAGGDFRCPHHADILFAVSIHAPVRGATGQEQGKGRGCQVSIHAPVRGATLTLAWQGTIEGVSIHAPVRGAT